MNILTWKLTEPRLGPPYLRGYLGKVQLFYIGQPHSGPYRRCLRNVLFPEQQKLYGATSEALKQRAEDRAQQMLKDMGVRPDD